MGHHLEREIRTVSENDGDKYRHFRYNNSKIKNAVKYKIGV